MSQTEYDPQVARKMSASERVIVIPELLEMIGLQLPPKDLIALHLINRASRASLTRTPSLQRPLAYRIPTPLQEQGSNTLQADFVTGPDSSNTSAFSNGGVRVTCENFNAGSRLCATVFLERYSPEDHPTILSANDSSSLQLWLGARGLPVKLTIRKCKKSYKSLNFSEATMLVKPSSLQELLEMAVSLDKAGERLEADVRYQQQWEWDEAGMLAWKEEPPNYDFDWKEFFTQEQIEKVLEAPEIEVR